MKRRKLDYHSGDEVIAVIRMLQKAGYEKTGNWNLTQILEYLTGTMAGAMDDPFSNEPPVDDWRQFMWLHASHHLSFLVPKDES